MKGVPYYGYVTSNVGDALGPWLIHAMGHLPIYTPLDATSRKVIVSGSILPEADERCTVWGAGIADLNAKVNAKATLLAVRGPISRLRAMQCGATCPPVIGDPGLLVPRFYSPKSRGFKPQFKVGVIPHFVDQYIAALRYSTTDTSRVAPADVQLEVFPPDGVKIIDVLQSVEAIAEQICSCERIVSSSLHGLILAVAYGVPARWAKFSDKLCGDGTKFHDFYLSLGANVRDALDLCLSMPDVDELCALVGDAPTPIPGGMLSALHDACPFKSGPFKSV